MDPWQSMDSAPRDGTVIVYMDDCNAFSTCAWQADDAGFNWYDIDGDGDQIAYPILWVLHPKARPRGEQGDGK